MNLNEQVKQAQQINPEHANHAKSWFLGYKAGINNEAIPEGEIERRGYEQALKGQDLVVLEVMPEFFKAQHRAALDWGTWPQNGAYRRVKPRADAIVAVASDPDGYAHIVEDARLVDHYVPHLA
jgi:hypothetical protein